MKSPGTLIATVALVVALGGNAVTYKNNKDVQKIADNNRATFCAYKTTQQTAQDEARKFLAMTPEQRMEKYGSVLGAIPGTVIQAQIAARQLVLDSLKNLDC